MSTIVRHKSCTMAKRSMYLPKLLYLGAITVFLSSCQAQLAHEVKEIDPFTFGANIWSVLQRGTTTWNVAFEDLFDNIDNKALEPLRKGINMGRQAKSRHQQELFDCVNDSHEPRQMTWAKAMNDELPSLKIVAMWWSNPKGSAEQNQEEQGEDKPLPLTLVTSCSLGRLDQLKAQCSSWKGPLSAAIHIPLLQDDGGKPDEDNQAMLRSAILRVSKLVANLEEMPNTCQLQIVLVYEVFSEKKAMKLFPVNTLRNLARLQAQTPLVALLDVDLLPSNSIYERFKKPEQYKLLLEEMKDHVFIMPGFEVQRSYEHGPWADALVTGGKSVITAAYNEKIVIPFHSERFPKGHGPTDFEKWINTKSDYGVKYEDGFEPWCIGDRIGMPWHDARFRGFGKNKIQHILNLRLLGYKFKVLHDAFAVHRPHEVASAAMTWFGKGTKKDKRSLRSHMVELLELQQAAGDHFKAVLTPDIQACVQKLSWWHNTAAANTMTEEATNPLLAARNEANIIKIKGE